MDQKATPIPFLVTWNEVMTIGTIGMVAAGILVYLVYKLRLSFFKEPKQRYDFINLNEIRWFKRVYFFFGLAAACAVNLYGMDKFTTLGLWFFVRVFFGIATATLIGYVAALILEFYYPTKRNFKRRKLRYNAR